MITRTILSAVVALGFSLSVQAETKRYTVTFKNSQTFNQVAQAYKSGASTMAFMTSPMAQTVASVASNVKVLEHVEVLVIDADSKALQALESNSQIAHIEEEVFHPAPPRVSTFRSSVPFALSPQAAIERPWGIDSVKAPAAWATTKGEGVTVAVIDTGLDSSHPSLNSRVIDVANFIGGDPKDVTDLVGHGTHVAGTVLADGLNDGLVGVAPEAGLYAARVCGTNGCSSVAIAEGVNWAVGVGADIINMSLGGGFMTFAEKAAYDKAEQMGVTIVAASGNDSVRRVSFPAAYTSILAVGATNAMNQKADFSNWGPELDIVAPGVDVYSAVPVGSGRMAEVELNFGSGHELVKSTSFQGSPARKVSDLPLVFAGLGKPEDFQGQNLTGKVALIQRGEITFALKVKHAIQAGAEGVVIFNNEAGLLQGGLTEDGSEVSVPVVMIEQTSGLKAKDTITQGSDVVTSMGVVPADYAPFQGTSMASPHVAGVAALVKAANPSLTPAQIRAILMQSATALFPNDTNEFGSGLVNAEAAVGQARMGLVQGLAAGF